MTPTLVRLVATFIALIGLSISLTTARASRLASEREGRTDAPLQPFGSKAVCPVSAGPGFFHCHALVVTDAAGTPVVTALRNAAPGSGYGPKQFRTAYGVEAAAAAATTAVVAIVDAFDNPNVKADLDVYNSTYGLPAFPSCAPPPATNAGCFRKVNQTGGTSPLPVGDMSWGQEIALDVQSVHAMCPKCGILLVEATSNTFANLLTAVDYAAANANVVSNSYGAPEFSGQTALDTHFNHTGVPMTVSSGDNGYGVEYPAASRYVTAVGGTTLTLTAANTRSTETAWGTAANGPGSGAGSGCSLYEARPAWQAGGCATRAVADVSADANPSTGAAVYDTFLPSGGGFLVLGGTSLASPLIAAVYALAGAQPSAPTYAASYPYANRASLFDVISGTNGSCDGPFLCVAGPGYDGPTGLGTPSGTTAFAATQTAPTLRSISVRRSSQGIVISWQTGQEPGATGFNVYRDRAGARTKLNRKPIASTANASHIWRDKTPGAKPTYYVELVRPDGSRTLYGPTTAKVTSSR